MLREPCKPEALPPAPNQALPLTLPYRRPPRPHWRDPMWISVTFPLGIAPGVAIAVVGTASFRHSLSIDNFLETLDLALFAGLCSFLLAFIVVGISAALRVAFTRPYPLCAAPGATCFLSGLALGAIIGPAFDALVRWGSASHLDLIAEILILAVVPTVAIGAAKGLIRRARPGENC